MKKFLVLDFYDNEISVVSVKDTYEEAYASMKEDYEEFLDNISSASSKDVEDTYIDNNSAFCSPSDGIPCWWNIKSIDV